MIATHSQYMLHDKWRSTHTQKAFDEIVILLKANEQQTSHTVWADSDRSTGTGL